MTDYIFRIFLTAILLGCALRGAGQNTAGDVSLPADTVTVMERINSILVTRHGSSTYIRVTDQNDDPYLYKAQVCASRGERDADLESRIAGASDRMAARREGVTIPDTSPRTPPRDPRADDSEAMADTLLKMSIPSTFVLTESSKGTHISVTALDDFGENRTELLIPYPEDGTIRVSQSRTSLTELLGDILDTPGRNRETRNAHQWSVVSEGLCLGMVNAGDATAAADFKMSKSWQITWMSILGVKYSYRRMSVSLGLGLDWRNFRVATPGKMLVRMPDRGVGIAPYPAQVDGDYSRLKIFAIQFPLLAELRVGPSHNPPVKFRAGPIFNINTHASIKTIGTSDVMDVRWSTSDIAPRRVTVDLFGGISIRSMIGVYVRWSPMHYMHTSSPINFAPLSVGISIGV